VSKTKLIGISFEEIFLVGFDFPD